jgi:hypothetical protein
LNDEPVEKAELEAKEVLEEKDIEDGDVEDAIEEDASSIVSDNEADLDYEEIEKLYQKDEVDSNIKATTNMISNILEDNKILEKKENFMVQFDSSRDNVLENEELSKAYSKKFVYSQYIYKDDTIKTLRNKITSSIKNNDIFGSENYLIPSRIYLWSDYVIGDKIEKVMIGQKWMKKNELLNIDVEPLKLNNYEELEGSIKNLRDILKRYGGKIRREDEDSNLYYDYENYIANDEIYMIDIYNELGLGYNGNAEKIKNLTFYDNKTIEAILILKPKTPEMLLMIKGTKDDENLDILSEICLFFLIP